MRSLAQYLSDYLKGDELQRTRSRRKLVENRNAQSTTNLDNTPDKTSSIDKLGHFDVVIYDPRYSRRLLATSCCMTLLPPLCIFFFEPKLYDMFILSSLVCFTSINHWRYPIFGIRRNIDLICAQSSVLYHFYADVSEIILTNHNNIILDSPILFQSNMMNLKTHGILILFGGALTSIGFYLLAVINRHNHHLGSLYHVCMHVTGIVWSIYLYYCLSIARAVNNANN